MKVFVTGGTGFIGSALVLALAERGDSCVVLSRRAGDDRWPGLGVRLVRGDPTLPGPWASEVDGVDAVINLAGERIVDPFRRWTEARKARLRASRIDTTTNLATAVAAARLPPAAFLSGSAIGYYGARGDDLVDESAAAGSDFLARLVRDWESAALAVRDRTRVALLRSGVVLGPGGSGGLAPLMLAFRLGLGGPWGDGRQWWSWVHLADAVGLMQLVLDRGLEGPVNLTAPEPVTVNEFAREMGRALRRPAVLRIPEGVARLLLGEGADALFNLQRVVPRRALEAGYRFRYPRLREALAAITAG